MRACSESGSRALFPLPCAVRASTSFLVGPTNQCKYMFARERVFATLTYIVALFATLMAGPGPASREPLNS